MKRFWIWMRTNGNDFKEVPNFKFLVGFKIEYLIEKANLGSVQNIHTIDNLNSSLDDAIKNLKEH